MSDQLLTIAGLGILALAYYVFLRILRSAWLAVRPPRATRRPGAPRLVVVEPPSLEGRSFVLGDDLILGRAAGCAATVDDGHVSQLHARVFRRGGRLLVEDLGPTNGTYLNRAKVTEPTIIRTGDLLRVGDTVLELS